MEWLNELRAREISMGDKTFRLAPGAPYAAAEIDAQQRKLGFTLPDDYRAFLAEVGAAELFGAKLVSLPMLFGHGEYPLDSPTQLTVFLPFAERPIPDGGKVVFAFRFEQDLVATLADAQAVHRGEARPPFHGLAYDVIVGAASHPTEGRVGPPLWLKDACRPIAKTFSEWAPKLAASLKVLAAQP